MRSQRQQCSAYHKPCTIKPLSKGPLLTLGTRLHITHSWWLWQPRFHLGYFSACRAQCWIWVEPFPLPRLPLGSFRSLFLFFFLFVFLFVQFYSIFCLFLLLRSLVRQANKDAKDFRRIFGCSLSVKDTAWRILKTPRHQSHFWMHSPPEPGPRLLYFLSRAILDSFVIYRVA